jgi:hypothetical protein
MIKKFCFFIFLLFLVLLPVKGIQLSDSIDISVLTVTPGEELYSTFGHSAIRVQDLKNNYDLVFNYGTFNFQTRGFYFKFALGKLDYQLAIEDFPDFMEQTREENRSIIEQKLNLGKSEKLILLASLIENYRPENRYYRYKFFTDNCATRIRDQLKYFAGPDFILSPTVDSGKTFRQLYRPYLNNMPWTQFGIEILLGPMADKPARADAMFLPEKLRQALNLVKVNNQKFVSSENMIFKSNPVQKPAKIFTPLILACIILFFSIAICFSKNINNTFDRIFLSLVGFIGLFVLFLGIFSAHKELSNNLMVFLFFPLVILIPWIRNRKIKEKLIYFSLIVTGLSLIALRWLPQVFNVAAVLISISVLVRLIYNAVFLKNNKNFFELIKHNADKK